MRSGSPSSPATSIRARRTRASTAAHSYYVKPLIPVQQPSGVWTEVEGTASNTVTITPNPADKVWDPGLPIGEDLQNFSPVANGRMVMPQDQRGTTASPAKVVVPQGQAVACEVEAATDLDHWTEGVASGYESGAANYAWTATGGTFDTTSSRSANWTAPNTPGKYTLTCTMSDGQTGARHDPDLVRNVTVTVPGITIQVRRRESGNGYAASATIAAGGCDSPEQKADVLVTVTPAIAGIQVPKPTIVGGDGVTDKGTGAKHDAEIKDWTGVTDADGKVRGVYWGSNAVATSGPDPSAGPGAPLAPDKPVTLQCVDSGVVVAQAEIRQRWVDSDGEGSEEYGDPTGAAGSISFRVWFKPVFQDGGPVPIHDHAIEFELTSVTLVSTDPSDPFNPPVTTIVTTDAAYRLHHSTLPASADVQFVRTLAALGTWGNAIGVEGPGGVYRSTLTLQTSEGGFPTQFECRLRDETVAVSPP